MATRQSIPPFPADIDRERFGNWFSGWTDGEGCFFAGVYPKKGTSGNPLYAYRVDFQFGQRVDDESILLEIQSFLQCGYVFRVPPPKHSRAGWPRNAQLQARFRVNRIDELHGIIIPTFERWPLRSKKRRDFEIWKECVHLSWAVSRRKRKTAYHGRLPSWTSSERARFSDLSDLLRKQRDLTTEHQLPVPAEPVPEKLLWD